MSQKPRKVLFPEIGHVTKFQEHAPKQKKTRPPNPTTPGAARLPPAFPPYEKLETADFQYFKDMRN